MKTDHPNSLGTSVCALVIGLALCFAQAASLAQEESFTLNLKNTDIQSLIATVSKRTQKNFVVDPRVKAKVTVISSHPMDAVELYQVFLSVLQVHGYAAVPAGKVTKIVPDVNAKQGPVPDLDNSGGRSDELVTHVVSVQHVPAAQLVPILRPLVPQQGHLAAYAATNMLVITDRVGNIGRLLKIIKRVDRPDNAEIEIIPLEHASASEVVRILGTLQQSAAQRGAPTPGGLRLAADERTNSVLISGERASRMRLRALIAHLDTPLETGGNTRVFYLRYAKAADLVTVLTGVTEGQARADQQGKGQQAQAARSKGEVDIQADEHTNALIITAPPDAMRSLLTVIRQLDIRRAQVLVEAIIAEISQDKTRELGVSFAIGGSSADSAFGLSNLGDAGQVVSGLASDPPVLAGGLTLALGRIDSGGTDFGFLVRAISSDAANNILSTPSLVTLDNQEAEIVVGQNVPFITGQFTDSQAATTTSPFQTIERQDVGITLKVKPQINEGNSIRMDIEQEVSSIAPSSVSTADIITNTRSIKTTVMVEDGQTLVLGGLIDDTVRDRDEKVPLLGDIPLLGRLFQYRSTSKVKQNLMVFLHPIILRDLDVENYYTGEKYSYLRSQQLTADDRGLGLLRGESPVLPELEVLTDGAKPLPPLEVSPEGVAPNDGTE